MIPILVTNENELWPVLFDGICSADGIIVTARKLFESTTKSESALRRACCNRFTQEQLYPVWIRHIFNKLGIPKHEEVRFLFLSCALAETDLPFLHALKKLGIHKNLLFIDSIACLGSAFDRMKPYIDFFDHVFSIDQHDANVNHWTHTYAYFSPPVSAANTISPDKQSDVFCCLFNKGRLKKAVSIYDALTRRSVSCRFFLSGADESFIDSHQRSGITYNQSPSYLEILDYVKNTNVILELVQSGQSCHTLRAFEAVAFGKNLLTDLDQPGFPQLPAQRIACIKEPIEADLPDESFFTDSIDPPEVDFTIFSPLRLFKQ